MREFGKHRFVVTPQPATKRDSPLPTIAGAVAAFTISAWVVLDWGEISSPGRWLPSLSGAPGAGIAPAPSGARLGRAATAPLLKVCVTKSMFGIDDSQEIEPAHLLDVLNASATAGRVASMFGSKPRSAAVDLATLWGDVADCVYRQNSWQLCDIDNRALAVHAANSFVRQVDTVLAQAASIAATAGEIQGLTSTRDRVVESLQSRVNSGAMIASDFAPFAPAAVRTALGKTRTDGNACAKP